MQLILELEKLNYRFWLEEGRIQFEYRGPGRPDHDTVRPLIEKLKARKTEAFEYLQARSQGKIIDFQAEAEKVRASILKKGVAPIQSNTLGEVIFFCRDNEATAQAPEGVVTYTLDELRELAKGNLTRKELKQIHEAKKTFSARIVENNKNLFDDT